MNKKMVMGDGGSKKWKVLGILSGILFVLVLLLCLYAIREDSANGLITTDVVDLLYFALIGVIACIIVICMLACFGQKLNRGGRIRALNILAAVVCVVTFIHDIFLFHEEGADTGGIFSMYIFLILDVLILLEFILMICAVKKASVLLSATVLIYMAGEIAGYTLVSFTDFDEFILAAVIFYVSVINIVWLYDR